MKFLRGVLLFCGKGDSVTMNFLEIEKVVGREILDSRGNPTVEAEVTLDRKSTRLNSSHYQQSRMPSSA